MNRRFLLLAASVLLCLSHSLPAQAKGPPRPIIIPTGTYTPDDGLGLGAYVRARQKLDPQLQAEEDRPWLWDLGVVALVYLKPYPVAWGFAATLSAFPKLPRRTEFVANLGSHGWHQDLWFGLGNDSLRDNRRALDSDGVSHRWHRFGLYQVRADARLYYQVANDLDVFGAAIFTYNRVSIRENTLLAQQEAAGLLVGSEGGFFLSLDGGIRLDNRDSRMDPTRGGLLIAAVQATFGPPGPSGRIAVDARGYLGTPRGEVVFAGSLIAQRQFGAVPFYEYGVIIGPEPRPRHFGGVGGVRGMARGRIRDADGLLLHGEVRFRPPGFKIGKLFSLRIEPVAFVDATRVGVLGTPSTGPALHPGLGGGVRFVISEQALFRIDLGAGPELQADFDGENTRWQFGVYATVGQSF